MVLSAAGDYKEIIKRVTVEAADVTEADFTLGGGSELYTKEERCWLIITFCIRWLALLIRLCCRMNTERWGCCSPNVDQEYGKDMRNRCCVGP